LLSDDVCLRVSIPMPSIACSVAIRGREGEDRWDVKEDQRQCGVVLVTVHAHVWSTVIAQHVEERNRELVIGSS
jgi:hypothetical protein